MGFLLTWNGLRFSMEWGYGRHWIGLWLALNVVIESLALERVCGGVDWVQVSVEKLCDCVAYTLLLPPPTHMLAVWIHPSSTDIFVFGPSVFQNIGRHSLHFFHSLVNNLCALFSFGSLKPSHGWVKKHVTWKKVTHRQTFKTFSSSNVQQRWSLQQSSIRLYLKSR